MDQPTRESRLRADHELLAALQAASSIFTFESTSQSLDRYTLTFRGKGLGRDASALSEVTTIELHQIDLRMPYSYPHSPPEIRWLTPILHPNVSFSGFVNLADIGLAWTKDLSIELVCERLWDIARGAFMNLDKATNYAAKNWFEKECKVTLPVDRRPLCDRGIAAGGNIVRYERRPSHGMPLAGAARPGEVVFIDESTPTPAVPQRQPYVPVSRRRPPGDDDVLYIGPE